MTDLETCGGRDVLPISQSNVNGELTMAIGPPRTLSPSSGKTTMCAIVVRTRELERAEAEALLAEQHVGAMAFAFRDRVAITLVNYVYRDPWIYARIEEGPDLEVVRHNQWVALEARAATGVFDWRTVTVNGSVEFLSKDGSS